MLHPKMRHIYIGVDTHRHTHTAVVINCFFEKLGEVTFKNKPSEFGKLLEEVEKHLEKGVTPIIGLEDAHSSGRELSAFLIRNKVSVKHVNSSLSTSERSNQSILHKNDSFDALCVARALLTKLDEVPNVEIKDDYWALSQLVSKRNALVKECNSLKNQLHAYIIHHYPSYKEFFYSFGCPSALAFWEKYPSPSKLKGVTLEELAEFLKLHSSRKLYTERAKLILDCIANDGDTTNAFQDTRDFIVTASIKQLKQNLIYIDEVESQIKSILPQFGYKLESMKGINTVTAASLIAEIGDINRFSTPAKLAKYSGISPVEYSSGQTDRKFCNRNGDRNLNRIFFCISVLLVSSNCQSGKPINPLFYEYYRKKLTEGKTKKQALKCVTRRLVNIIWGMMKNKTEYILPE